MVPMTAEQRARVEARLDELMEDVRDIARRLEETYLEIAA